MKQDNNGTLSKAKIWWDKLSIDDKILLTQKHFIGIPLHTLMDKSIEAMYIYENPQPTDTGNTVSSEVAVVDFLNKKYRGKLVDNAVTLALSKQLLIDFYNETYTLHDALVSALKEAMDIIERMDTDINSSPTRTERKRLTDLLNNISNK